MVENLGHQPVSEGSTAHFVDVCVGNNKSIARTNEMHTQQRTMRSDQAIPELSTVVLRHAVEGLPEGRRGTVVHAWRDGKHYAVEFTGTVSRVIDLERDDIQPV
jgi:hypothetical protein